MNETLLSVSWLNGHVRAVAVHHGKAVAAWEKPDVVADVNEFGSVLTEAVSKTGYDGVQVGMVVAHPRLAQQLVETPALKRSKLKWFLYHRAKRLKSFDADAVWSYQTALPTKSAGALVLQILPKPLVDQLAVACHQAGLRLTRVFPTSAILQRQLPALPLAADDVALVAAETNGTTTVVIGRKDGQIYLARSLSNSWNVYPDRVNVDLNRTILYAKQQFGVSVSQVWLVGGVPPTQIQTMQTALKVPVKAVQPPPLPTFWNQELANLSAEDTNNFLTTEQQQAPKRRVMLTVTSILIALLALAALGSVAVVHVISRYRTAQYARLEEQVRHLQARKVELQQRETTLQQQKQFAFVVTDQMVPPVPGWFLGFMGDAVPDELLLTQVQLKREDDRWLVQVKGSVQSVTNQPLETALAEATALLKERLTNGPFHVRLLSDTEAQAVAPTNARPAGPVAVQAAPAAAPGPDQEDQFYLQGVMR